MTFLILAFVESLLITGAAHPRTDTAASSVSHTVPQVAVTIDSAELAGFIDPLIMAQIAKEQIPGAVFILVQNGRVLYQRGYGFANLADRKPADPGTTIWRIASISKVFTATAVVQPADRAAAELHSARTRRDVSRSLPVIRGLSPSESNRDLSTHFT